MKTASTVVFIGHEQELADLGAGIEAARNGRATAFFLTGDAGIGKTRLAEEVALTSRAAGLSVLWGSCREDAGQPPYWPWVQILRADLGMRGDSALPERGQEAHDVSDMLAGLRPGLRSESVRPAGDDERFYLFDAIARHLRGAAAVDPLLIVLDDLHAADTPSLLLLRFLLRELRDERLLLIGTYRTVEAELSPERGPLLSQLLRSGRHLPLGGLSESEIARLIESISGVTAEAGLSAAVHEATAGNPFFADEMIRLLRADGRLAEPAAQGGDLRIPHGVRGVIRERLSVLGEDCRRILTAAAVRGQRFEIGLIEAVTGLPRERLLHGLGRARTAALIREVPSAIGQYGFAHGLVRDAIYEELDEPDRVLLHGRIAQALEELHGTDVEAVLTDLAYHYARAALGGEWRKAVDYAQRAGDRAAALVAHEDAATHYEQALQALALAPGADERRRCELLLAVAEQRARSGDRERARAICLEVSELARKLGLGDACARAALCLGGPWVEIGRVDAELVKLLESAARELGEQDSPLRVQVLARLSRELYWSEEASRGAALAEEGVRIAARLGDPGAQLAALSGLLYSLWRPDEVERRLTTAAQIVQLADALGDREMALRGHLWRLTDLLEIGDIGAADGAIENYARLAEQVRQPSYLWYAPRNRAMRALLEGRFEEAEELAKQAYEIGARAHTGIAVQALGVLTLVLRWERGEIDGLPELVEHLRRDYPALSVWRCGQAFLYAEQGRAGEARRALDELAADGLDRLPQDANWLPALSLLSVACSELGDAERAAELYALLSPYRRRNVVMGRALVCFGCTSYYLGALATVLGRCDEAAGHLDDALHMHERLGARPWWARTQTRLADLLLLRGDRDRAARCLSAAIEVAEAVGMSGLLERIRHRHEQLPQEHRVRAGNGLGLRARETEPALPVAAAVFRREGDYWTIRCGGTEVRLKDSKGLRYLALLLSHPNRSFHVMELAAGVACRTGQEAGAAATSDWPLDGMRISRLDDAEEVLDTAARASYERRISELRAELDEAETFNDCGRAFQLHGELDFLVSEIALATGLRGRRRRQGSPAERARISVTKQIKVAIGRIEAHSPSLARDLRHGIRTGRLCSYEIDPRAPIRCELA